MKPMISVIFFSLAKPMIFTTMFLVVKSRITVFFHPLAPGASPPEARGPNKKKGPRPPIFFGQDLGRKIKKTIDFVEDNVFSEENH